MTQIQRIPVGDLSSPFMRVRFYASVGTIPEPRAPGQQKPPVRQTQSPSPELSRDQARQDELDTAELHKYVTELRADINNSMGAQLQITLTPPFPDAVQIIENRLIRRDSIIVAQWGYSSPHGMADKISRPFVFTAQEPQLDVNSTDITITIKGTDILGSALARNEQRRVWSRISGFPTDLRIVEALVRRQGLQLDLSELPSTSSLYTTKSDPEALEQFQNDWIFFQEILRQNNAGFVTLGNKVLLYDEEQSVRGPAIYRFRFYNQLEDAFDIPMLNFQANPHGYFFHSPETRTVVARTTDMNKGTITVEKHDAQTDRTLIHPGKVSQGGDTATGRSIRTPEGNMVPTPVTEDNAGGVHLNLSPDKHNREELGKQIMRVGAMKANTHAKLTAVGVPFIIPHIQCIVDCAIPSFSGRYYINKVSHVLGLNGYDMEIDVVRASMGEPNDNTSVPVGPKETRNTKQPNNRTPQQTEAQPR